MLLSSSFAVAVVVSTECRWCRLQDLQDLPEVALVLWSCVPRPFLPFLLCLWCIACKYAFIWRFKGVFSGFYGADVYLCGLRSLRGLRGFCARVRLGGFGACCVFAFVFLLLSLCLLSFYALCLSSGALPLLSSACPLACLVCSCVLVGLCFLFPLRTIRKKKGRNFLRPLSFCCGVVISL